MTLDVKKVTVQYLKANVSIEKQDLSTIGLGITLSPFHSYNLIKREK
jgi:hypothetical protein